MSPSEVKSWMAGISDEFLQHMDVAFGCWGPLKHLAAFPADGRSKGGGQLAERGRTVAPRGSWVEGKTFAIRFSISDDVNHIFSQQPCSWVSISGPGPGATFHGRENPEHLAVEPVEPVEPVALETLHFLNPRNFWNLWNQLNAWGSTGSKHSLGSTTPLVPQVPDRFLGFNHATGSTGSRQVPWVQPRHWFHRFHRSSLGLTTPWVQQVPCRFFGFNTPLVPQVPDKFLGFNHATGSTGFQTGSLGWNTQSFHNFQTVSLGSTTPLIPQVPDRFLGFNRGTVGIVGGVNFGNCPNYVLLNAPLCRTILKWAGIRFWQECLSRIETTPLVPQVPDRFLGFNHATGSTGSRQVAWVQPRHWFHRFQTGSLGSNTPLVSQVPDRFLGFNLAMGSTGWTQGTCMEQATPLVSHVPDRFLGFNRGTVGIVEGVYHQTVVLFNVR